MIDRARWFLPEIGALSAIRVWTGFRAATPDKLPLIGPCPEDESMFLATGHEGLGITTSLGTASTDWQTICKALRRRFLLSHICRHGSRGVRPMPEQAQFSHREGEWRSRDSDLGNNGCCRDSDDRSADTKIGDWRTARATVRDGHLLRMPSHHRWRTASADLPGRLRPGHGGAHVVSEHFDILVVGAGPAGIAAAVSASASGKRVGLVDDNPAPGGQIWRSGTSAGSGSSQVARKTRRPRWWFGFRVGE